MLDLGPLEIRPHRCFIRPLVSIANANGMPSPYFEFLLTQNNSCFNTLSLLIQSSLFNGVNMTSPIYGTPKFLWRKSHFASFSIG